MRPLLRVIAGFTLLPVVWAILLVLRVWQRGGLLLLPGVDTFGWFTYLSWLVAAFLGPFAIVQLWRFRPSGRIADAVVWGIIALQRLGFLWFRQPIVSVAQELFLIGISSVLFVALLLPAARQACPPQGSVSGALPTA